MRVNYQVTSGMDVSLVTHLKQLEGENRHLKKYSEHIKAEIVVESLTKRFIATTLKYLNPQINILYRQGYIAEY